MLTAIVENMFVTSIGTTLENGVVPTQYIVIISTVRQQSELNIQCWIGVHPIVNFCLGSLFVSQYSLQPTSSIIYFTYSNLCLPIFLHRSTVPSKTVPTSLSCLSM